MTDAIEIVDVRKRYGAREAVRGVSLSVARGELVALVGPNGAGKTTLVEMTEGLRRPDSGRIRVLGLEPGKERRVLAARVGIQLQTPALYDRITVREAVDLFASFYPSSAPPLDLLRRFDLAGDAGRAYADLSGGQRKRLALLLAVMHDPDVVFLDEPTAGLDPEARHALWDLLRGLRANGKTIVLTTHDIFEAETLADRVAMIADGRIVALGHPSDLMADLGIRRTIRVRVAAGADLSWLGAVDGVQHVRHSGGEIVICTADEALTARALARLGPGLVPGEAVARPATLEDAYLSVMSRRS